MTSASRVWALTVNRKERGNESTASEAGARLKELFTREWRCGRGDDEEDQPTVPTVETLLENAATALSQIRQLEIVRELS